ncbi:DUF2267 domain-containing protein [Sinorhizobium arboris]|uniref:DUF2267 domain-containing protein n=1 Tax=Sinorhizobium arboris TaxID=76745 RepID=UPI0003FC4B69|nr:DUF2267 domain-containing protein [Sinorhizobium arboris]
MSTTGLDVFDKTLQLTNTWLDEIMAELGPDRQVAWHALNAVLRTLRDRLPIDTSVHLASQLPLLLRGSYYEQWQPARQTNEARSLDEFLQQVGAKLQNIRPVNARDATQVVFHVLSRHVDRGQLEKVRASLTDDVRQLWPESALNEAPSRGPGGGISARGAA